ncbi:MAG: J domain-containing protein [Acidobacteria bacterium]|nr:J domain-containing protein [Acidobacteriota bacterium]
MNLNFNPTGVLTETPFVELAGAINQQRLTGSLYLIDSRADLRAERIIYFSQGEVYAAASNLAPDSALAILMRAGRVTQEAALGIQQEVAGGRSFSEALVMYGCVTREELNQLRIEHVKSIFDSLCEWASGEYRFTEGTQVLGGNLGISAKALLISGSLSCYVPRYFREWITDPCILVTAHQAITSDVKLQPFAYFVLSCLNQPRNLSILMESGRMNETEQEVLQQLYGLYCAGLVSFAKTANPTQNPLLTAQPIRLATPAEESTSVRPQETEVCMALTWPVQEDPETAKRRQLAAIKRDIKKIRQVLSSANDDYAVLGLNAGATPTEVKHSYRLLVNHYHPDRHHPYSDTITLATLSDILMAIRAAYETAIEHALLAEIINSNTRRYQAVRRTQGESLPIIFDSPNSQNSVPQSAGHFQHEKLTAEAIKSRNLSLAEVKHRQALTHQSRGEFDFAIGLLTDAVTLAPDCARYHGELAALLEKMPMRREQAEQHFLRATELEPSNLFYHLQLGSFYRAIGLLSRAEQQFILALKLDPVDRAAASALEEVMSLKNAQTANAHYGRKRAAKGQGFWARIFNRNG